MDTVSDVSRAHVIIIPTIVTSIIALIFTVLRLYVRIRITKMVNWDDFFNVLALITMLVAIGLIFGAVQYGLGRHFGFLDPVRATYSVMLLRIAEIVLIFSTIFVKISVSLFLKRLFLTSEKWEIFFWIFITFNTITSLIDAIVVFPECTPIEFNWDTSIPGHCWPVTIINALGILQGTISAVTDMTLSMLPIIFLWRVNIFWKIKLGICGIMCLGFASGGFAVARTVAVARVVLDHSFNDPTWELVPLFISAALEATFGVIAAAAPSLRPLFGHTSATAIYFGSHSNTLPQHNIISHQRSSHSLSGIVTANPVAIGIESQIGPCKR